jgi:DNA topoisomerase-1
MPGGTAGADPVEAVPAEAERIAESAGLHYADQGAPGIRRTRRGKGFSYVDPGGRTLTDRDERERIAALAIPPAWTDVWINPDADGHILATGRDARGRKQYRYHPRWRQVRDEAKYERLAEFADALPDLRGAVDADLRRRGLVRDRIVALVVRLLDDSLIRVGNPEYAADNGSYGLTTLRDSHLEIDGDLLTFDFTGKSGVAQRVQIDDPRLARLAARCHELPGKQVFAFLDDEGRPTPVSSTDVNDYLRSRMGPEVSAKDFRTWGGTTVAAATLALGEPPDDDSDDRAVLAALDVAATVLGNTRAVCRSCYVHPRVIDAHRSGELKAAWANARAGVNISRPERAVRRVLG